MDKFLKNTENLVEIIPEIIFSLLIISSFLILRFFIKKTAKSLLNHQEFSEKRHLILSISHIITYFLGMMVVIIILGSWGVEVSSILAGLGLTGFALGFALKDILTSAVAGLFLIFYRPFKIKSKISVLGVEGVVADIDMRYVKIKEGQIIHLIPNSRIIVEKVTILTAE